MSQVPKEYNKQKQAVSPLTLKTLLAIVDRFRDPEVRCMASICSMGYLASPHSTKYHYSSDKSTRERAAEQKISISKFSRLNRKRKEEGRHKETPRIDGSEPKKLSLSFSKSQRNEL